MFKKIILILALICMIVLPVFGQTGSYTTNEYFYLPEYGAYGTDEYNEYNLYMEKADKQIEANKDRILGAVTTSGTPVANDIPRFTGATVIEGLSYAELKAVLDLEIGTDVQAYDAGLLSLAGLTYASPSFIKVTAEDTYTIRTIAETKTDLAYQLSDLSDVGVTTPTDTYALIADGDSWESRALVEADISDLGTYLENITGESIGDLSDIDLTDIANLKILQYNSTSGNWECEDATGGYINLTSFVDQTAWRLFYSSADGDVVELPLGADGTYLGSNGETSAPSFGTPSGAGDMLKATYDSDEDSDIDVAAGGTEKSSWTLYAIPYLSGTTAFGEIPIGTAEYALTVNAGANGYDWTLFDLSLYYLKTEIDTQGELETIWGDTLMNDLVDDTTPEYGGAMDHNNERDTEVKTIEFNGLYDNGNSGATPTIDWQNGNYQKIAVSENTLFTFSNAFIGTITLQITYSGAYTAGFNAGYTILEEGGIEISFTETLNAVDILKVMYLGTANNYVVGLMADVKD